MFNFLANFLIIGILAGFNFYPSYTISEIKAATGPMKINKDSIGVELSAKSAIVVDESSSAFLFSKNSSEPRPIASITKLMTALVFLEHNPGWENVVEIETQDKRDGNLVLLWPGEKVTVLDLFNLTLVSSTNEAAAALVRSTGLSEESFVGLMNEKAASLGLEHTKFFGATGLNSDNISTAYDLAKLAKEAFSSDEISEAAKKTTYQFTILNNNKKRIAYTTDELLWSFLNNQSLGYSIEGAKTGYLDEALYCMAAKISKDGHNIIIVILGAKSSTDRWQEVKGLADWTFDNYSW